MGVVASRYAIAVDRRDNMDRDWTNGSEDGVEFFRWQGSEGRGLRRQAHPWCVVEAKKAEMTV